MLDNTFEGNMAHLRHLYMEYGEDKITGLHPLPLNDVYDKCAYNIGTKKKSRFESYDSMGYWFYKQVADYTELWNLVLNQSVDFSEGDFRERGIYLIEDENEERFILKRLYNTDEFKYYWTYLDGTLVDESKLLIRRGVKILSLLLEGDKSLRQLAEDNIIFTPVSEISFLEVGDYNE